MILLKELLTIRNGIPMATIERYCEAYPIVASLAPIRRHTGTENIVIIIIAITPIAAPVQKQNAEICLAISRFPSPSIRLIIEVPPIPNNIPTAMNIINAGVAMETAATISGSLV